MILSFLGVRPPARFGQHSLGHGTTFGGLRGDWSFFWGRIGRKSLLDDDDDDDDDDDGYHLKIGILPINEWLGSVGYRGPIYPHFYK